MNFIKTDEKIVDMITSIAKRGGSLQKDIHRAACSILNRWCVTEDVSTATKHMNMLLDALPVMVRSNAFKDWGVHMAGLVWSEVIRLPIMPSVLRSLWSRFKLPRPSLFGSSSLKLRTSPLTPMPCSLA